MATLDTLVYQFQRTLSFEVRINGVVLSPNSPLSDGGVPAISSISISKSLDNPVPVCQIELSHLPTWITRGMTATVDLGYNNIMQRVFTGFVQDRSRKVAGCTLRCLGQSYSLYRTIQIDSRDFTNKTVQASLVDIVSYVGISNYNISVSSYTMGTSGTSIKLERMPASQMAQMLADIDGSRIYENNNGTLIIRYLEEIPAISAFAAYKTSDQSYAIVLDGSDREDPEYFRDQVIVTGATLDASGSTESTTLTSTATLANTGGFIQPPLPSGSHIQTEYSNSLIDTQSKLDALALLLLSRFGRVPRYLTINIAGDPRLDLTQTIELDFTEMGVADSLWFISGIEHHIDATGGYRTQLQLRGGSQLGGTLDLNPIASYTYSAEQEVMGGVVKTVVALDASASYDPDGTISTYTWTSNQPVTIANGKQVTIAVDTTGWIGDWDITLTITDSSGNTDSITQTIPYTSTAVTFIPAMYVAMNNNYSATPDGGVTWNDQSVSASAAISVGARPANGQNTGYACYGRTDGTIWRATDGDVSAPTQVASGLGSAVNDIQWDWRFPDTVWALTDSCQLWKSGDFGATWALAKDLRTVTYISGTATASALGNVIGLPGGGGIYVFGGDGAGNPLIAYDPDFSGNWVHQTFTGDLATDMPADATMRIVMAAAPGDGHTTIILSWASGGGASIVAIYDSASDPGPSAAYTRATGLTAGLKTGHLILGEISQLRYAFFNDQDVWYSTDCVAYTRRASVLPAGVTANHGVMLSDNLTGYPTVPGVGVLACQNAGKTLGIYKSVDGFQTVVAVRPVTGYPAWPSNSMAMKIAIGAPTGSIAGATGLAIVTGSANPHSIEWLNAEGLTWHAAVTLPSAIDNWYPQPYCLTKTHWFVSDQGGFPDPESTGTTNTLGRLMVHSTDGGLTWATLPIGDEDKASATYKSGILGVAMAADGTIYGVRKNGFFSPNSKLDVYSLSGTTWTFLKQCSSGDTEFIDIAAHPTNANYMALAGLTTAGSIFVTKDKWATFTTNSLPTAFTGSGGHRQRIFIFGSGRIMVFVDTGIGPYTSYIYTSDDDGATWTQRYTTTLGIKLAGINATTGKAVLWMASDSSSRAIPIVSLDYGTTWTALTSLDLNVAASNANVSGDQGSVYDPENDVLFTIDTTDSTKFAYKLTPVAAGGTWTNITDSIPNKVVDWQTLAVVPSA